MFLICHVVKLFTDGFDCTQEGKKTGFQGIVKEEGALVLLTPEKTWIYLLDSVRK